VNGPPGGNGVSLFTPAYGAATPSSAGSVELALGSFPQARPNAEITATVSGASANGGTPIPVGGAVLVARGTAATFMQKEAVPGQVVRIRLILKPAWSTMADALGGGPVLVRNGKPIFRANEQFTPDQLLPRTARSAVGHLADGRILLVTVDGARAGYSVGATNFELALEMAKLGAVTAVALDGGASSAMAFDGKLLSRPSGAERPLGDALVVAYGGVYVPPPPEPVLSPNGDGLSDSQRLAYKVVRLSTVSVNLIGPDGVPRYSFSGQAAPGTYPLDWSGTTPAGSPELEGRWRWVVTATDDAGVASSGERDFVVNRTLGFATPVGATLTVPRPKARVVATFQVTRAATITPRIETASGVLLRTLPRVRTGPGDLRVSWDGVTDGGAVVYSGRFVAEVTATNELGSVSLGAPFVVHRANVFKVAK
jgi:hypothetical protein